MGRCRLTHHLLDRQDALKDDFHLEQNYDYEDEDDWGEEDSAWQVEDEPEAENTEVRDESTAYLEFLNEEARFVSRRPVCC